jgi:hypothetical protein
VVRTFSPLGNGSFVPKRRSLALIARCRRSHVFDARPVGGSGIP